MIRNGILALAAALALLGSCSPPSPKRTQLVIQRIFGACEAEYGAVADVAKAEGECGIMTAAINRFQADNPDIDVVENIVFWPGYDQLTAQLAANDPPDLVTMHGSVIADYQARGLLDPLGPELVKRGVAPASFTDAARAAVTIDGAVWGLPIDTWTQLWQVNLNLFRKAGLVKDGKPVMPRSPEELFAQAQQFRERTGKPYLIQATANEYANFARNFYTFVMQQGGTLFTDARHANFRTPEAHKALQLFRTIHERNFTTRNQDYSAAVSSFLNGGGGVTLAGTWMVGTFDEESRKPGRPLSDGYTVVPYPQLFSGRDVTFGDGHNWVMPHDPRRTPAEREAALRFLVFFASQDAHWARTGHLPSFQAVIDSPAWRSLPHRSNLADLAQAVTPLRKDVRRQFPLENIVGQEAAAAISGAKPIDQALADMERRVNTILQNL
ncbi:extracellular solute-binding protein [Sphingomonas sp.]|jgi:multiple sugar transport system substrate-binding protein|uniref:extracellular solute-binding protein n=1 Tax=Sphingomonas sp. TaxID=28214 RepID=UPI002ED9498D